MRKSDITLRSFSVSDKVRLDVGSSIIIILAFFDRALAISTICCCPMESSETGVSGEISRPSISMKGLVFSIISFVFTIPRRRGSLPKKTLAPTSRLSRMFSS